MRLGTLALVCALFTGLMSVAGAQDFVAVANGSANRVTVTWGAVTGATGYVLVRAAGSTTATPTLLTPTPITARSFDDVLPTGPATYYYQVGTTAAGRRLVTPWVAYSVPVTAPLPAPIAPGPVNVPRVTGLALSNPLPNGVTLTWGAAPGAVGYVVYRQGTGTTAPTALVQRTPAPITALTYTDRDALDARVTYVYTVSAIDANGLSGDAAVNFTPPPPQDPTGFTATLQGTDAVLRWNSVPGALKYLLAGSTLGTGVQVAETTYTVRGLGAGVIYIWTVATAYAPAGTILTQAANWPKASVSMPAVAGPPLPPPVVELQQIWGFADLHVHQFNNLSFGGFGFHGSPFGPMNQALPPCTFVHGFDGAADMVSSANLPGGHPNGGYPDYKGWPRFDTYTHQQVYADWLKRAHDGGLQLMAMLASNNPFLCTLFMHVAPGRSCDDTEALDYALAAAKQMEQWVDQQNGGPGKGWYRIVYSPKQARDAIASGQLAVVLGIEMPTLFECYEPYAYKTCTPDYVRAKLKKYYDLGVRQITPIHSMDNAFGGTAMYHKDFNTANFFTAGHGFESRDCTSEGVRFNLDGVSNRGDCNKRGLTSLGEFYLKELMSQKILIDVDHMSRLSLEGAFAIAQQYDYPVMTSHSWFFNIALNEKKAEGHLEPRDFQRIRKLGGVVSAITAQGGRNEILNPDSRIPNDCGYSSQAFAQAYLHAIKEFGGPVAFGSDFNGFAGQPAPRFGPDGCWAARKGRGEIGPNVFLGGQMPYPFPVHGVPGRMLDRSVIGQRTYDYNTDGLAHIGMLPDLVQDMKTMGVTDAELEPLFHSAEQYIRMWEKAESRSVPPPPPPGTPVAAAPLSKLTVSVAETPASRGSTTVTVTAVDAATAQSRSGTVMVGGGKGGATFVTGTTGQPLTVAACTQYDPTSRKWDRVPCKGTVAADGYANAPFTVGQGL